MEHEPPANWAAFRQHRPCQIAQIAGVTSQSASPLCPTSTPTSLPLQKKEKRKLTSLIICQTKHYSSWFRSAMLALHSQSISSLSGPKSASLGLIAQSFVPFVCENGKSIWKSSPMSCHHAELGAECCRYEMEIRKTTTRALILAAFFFSPSLHQNNYWNCNLDFKVLKMAVQWNNIYNNLQVGSFICLSKKQNRKIPHQKCSR